MIAIPCFAQALIIGNIILAINPLCILIFLFIIFFQAFFTCYLFSKTCPQEVIVIDKFTDIIQI